MLLPAACLMGVGYISCNVSLAVFLIIAGVGFVGMATCIIAGSNQLDLAPPYAGFFLFPSRIISSNSTCYSAAVGERSIVISLSVCLFVRLSVREHISGTAGPIFTNYFCADPRGRGSVLL